MQKMILALGVLGAACMSCGRTPVVDEEEDLAYCHEQVKRALAELAGDGAPAYDRMPRNILRADEEAGRKGWNCREAVPEEWCSGFWPGILWYDYEFSKDSSILEHAKRYTASLAYLADRPAFDHDLGFLVFCSFGNAYRLTKDLRCKEVIVGTARQLAALYNPTVGTLLSWPREVERQGWPHNTIMDNMINLEMLFWAARNGGGDTLRAIAVRHAETTMNHHFRPDGSCYHVAVYDTTDGHFVKGVTHQGYADTSTWSRGQAWAVYGYTMVYRETREPRFLDFACRVTDLYLDRLQETSTDWVPAWDFDAPGGEGAVPKDASAACVVASALLELSDYVADPAQAERYEQAACRMLASLRKNYASEALNVAFLRHSTGHHPAGSEIDASIVYADYYYIEALLRLRRKKAGQPVYEHF